jgi:hypothetical protein
MGAVGLNGAAGAVEPADQRLRVANAGWARWTPVNLAGIAAHLAGGAVLLVANKGRLAGQRGVATATIAKTALTGLAWPPPATRGRLGPNSSGSATPRSRAAPPPLGAPRRRSPRSSGS